MLLRFACSNFKSIKDRQEILFTAAKGVKNLPDAPRTVEGYKKNQLLPVIAVYGANASGKSNMLEALAFIKRAALRSHVDWESGIPRKPFRLDPACADLPSTFDIDFLINSTRYHYGFSVDDEKVLEEWLYAVRPGRAQQVWFERKAAEKTEYGGPIKAQGAALEGSEVLTENSLILPLLLRGKSDEVRSLRSLFETGIDLVKINSDFSKSFDLAKRQGYHDSLAKMLKTADVGINGFDLIERDLEEVEDIPSKIKDAIKRQIDKQKTEAVSRNESILDSDFSPKVIAVEFEHAGESGQGVKLSWGEESTGTKRFFELSGPTLKVLKEGGCVVVDELDNSLHPLLARAIIRLFTDPKSNPKGAQLFFTTHDINLLAKEVLRRDQVWLTEKDRVGATHVYPLSDFDINDDTDLERAYLEGRFGGVPLVRNLLSTTAS